MSAPAPIRSPLTAVLFTALIASPLTASAQSAPKDLGARTFVGQEGEFKVLLTWSPNATRQLTLSTTRPGSVPVLMCFSEGEELKALPKKVTCDYGREFSLAQTKTGYSLSIGKELVKELSFGQEKPSPTVFKLSAVNPFEITAPGSGPYAVRRGGGNRSSETRHLPSPKAGAIPTHEEVGAWIRKQGLDPAGIPMDAAESLWRRFDEASRDPFLGELPENERQDRFQEILRSVLADL